MSIHNFKHQCAGKQKHPSFGKAEAHVRSLARTSKAAFESYLCRFCRHWHVGHKLKRGAR